MKKLNQAEVVTRIKNIFGGRMTVLGQYTRNRDPLLMRCEYGHEWASKANDILNGHACPYCKASRLGDYRRLSLKEANRRIEKIYQGKVIPLIPYPCGHNRWLVCCNLGHKWAPVASSLIKGDSNCPDCAEYGFQVGKPAIAYYARFNLDCGTFWKIGVTNRTVTDRFARHKTKPVILDTWTFTVGSDA